MGFRYLAAAALACLLAAPSAFGQTNLVTLDPDLGTDPLNSAWSGGEWNADAEFGGWTTGDITGATVSGGVLSGSASTTAPAISLTGISGGPDFDLGYNDFLDLRLKLPVDYTGEVKIYYGVVNGGYADGDPGPRNLTGFDASRCFTIPNANLSKDGAFHTYRVNLSLEVWCRGQLNDLRIVPATVAGTAFEIDYVRIGDTGPVLGVKDYDTASAPFTFASKNFVFGWNQASIDNVGMNEAWAKLNLRNAEEMYAHNHYKLNYPRPRWQEAGGPYKLNFYCTYGGNYSNTWNWLSVSYYQLRTDPPSWTIQHELTHAFQGRLNGGNVPGSYYEFHANYGVELWLDHYKELFPMQSAINPGVLGDMHLNLPTGRNYYLTWLNYLYFEQNPDNLPGLGPTTIFNVWQQMGPGENTYQTLKRLLPTGTSVKDVIGSFARRGLHYNYPNHPQLKHNIGYIREWEQLTEPIRRPDDPTWWQIPAQRAPMQSGFTISELVPTGTGAGRVVTVDLRGLVSEGGNADLRGSLIVVNDAGDERFSNLIADNSSVSMTLAADENKVYLVVAATPEDYQIFDFDEVNHPYRTDPGKRRFRYEFKVTGATPKERDNGGTSGLVQHANGGGWKASTATVASTAYIGPNARVLDSAQVLGNARVEDFAVVRNNARLQDSAIARGHAQVSGNAVMSGRSMVSDFAKVEGSANLSGSARVLEHAAFSAGVVTDQSVMKGVSGVYGGTMSGNAIVDGDYSKARDIRNAVMFSHAPWAPNPDSWLIPLPTGIYACYEFNSDSESVVHDTHTINDGIYRGAPEWISVDGARTGITRLNGSDQWIQLERSVSELHELSLTTWVKWEGGVANQTLFQFGDGGSKFVSFTPSNGSGVAELRASNGTSTYSITAASALPVGVWCQLAISLNGTTGTFSVNGTAAGSGSLPVRPYQFLPPNTAANPAHNFIGRSTAGNFFVGSFDDFKVYSVASPTFLLVSADALETTVPENAPNAVFRITRSSLTGSSTSGNLTVNYTISGTALAGSDYIAPSGTVVIPDGKSYVDVEIPFILDDVIEPDETLILSLTASNDFANFGSGSATVSIPNVGNISDSMLAWYKFDETSGTTANDSSGKNNHATLVNGPAWNAAEKALSFDDANDDNDHVQTPVPNGGTRTLSAWFRPESSTWIQNIWNYNAVFDSDVPGAYGAGWGVVDNKIRVMLDDTMWDTGIPVTLNQWQHGSLTFDSTRARFYLNGVLQGSFSYVQGGITTANYTIGSKAFDGQLREAKILNRVIYSAEAMEMYQAGAPQRAPQNLTALAGHGNVTLAWQPAGVGESAYIVRRATITGGPYTDIAMVASTSFADNAVTNGMTYHYVVAAVNQGVPGPNSNQASATPVAGSALPPPWQHQYIPTSVTATASTVFSGGQVAVSGGGSRIGSGNNTGTDSFRFVYIPVVGDCTVTARVMSLSGTNNARRAGVMVRQSLDNNALHASTLFSPSNTLRFVRRTSSGGNGSTTNVTPGLSQPWVRIQRSGTTFTSFYSADGVNWTQQIGTNQTIGMSSTGVYYVGLAVCSGTSSAVNAVFSNVSITGGYPTGLTATAGDAQVALSWNEVTGASSYRVKRATTSGGPYTTLTPNPPGTTFTDTTAVNGTTYYYVVSAHNGTSESANSSQVFATPSAPLASIPQGLLASDSGTSVQLTWSASTNATGYRVKRATSLGGALTVIGSPTGTSFTDPSATAGQNFHYTVAAVNSSNIESGDSEAVSVIRALYFDPNGPAVGSVTDGGTYNWLTTTWAYAAGGTFNSGSWLSGKQAVFAATSPGAPLAYSVDLTNFNTGTHGHFTGIRALAGTVNFTGNVSNLYLTSPVTVTAETGASIVFQQTRSGGDVMAFNLNGQPATFHGDITINSAGIGNNGSIIVGSGNLKLGNAIANYSPAATTLEAGTTLTNIGDAGKSFNLGALTMNGATLAATNAGHTSWGNYLFSGSLNVGGTAASLISADIRCGNNATHALNIGETGEDVDLLISGKLGHFNGLSWGYANKTGSGTLKLTGINNLGGMTVSEGTVILEGPSAIASMDMTSLTNNAAVILSVPTGTVTYLRTLQGNGLYTKTGAGTLELTTTSVHGGNVRVQEGILRMTQPSLGNASAITIDNGAQIDLGFTGRDTIGSLVINGVTLPAGIYSAATHPASITGTGSLKVAASTILAWNNSAGTGIWNASDVNWTSQSWQNLSDALISHTNTAQVITLNGSLNAADIHIGNGSNNANYTLSGSAGSNLSALAFNVQGASTNDPGLGAATLSNLNAQIATDLRVGRWDLVIGGTSTLNIAGQLRSTSDGSGSGDWGRVTLQDSANVTATGGVNGAGSVWGLTLNGGTLTTPFIRAADNAYGAGSRLTLNGTTIRATQQTTTFLTVDSTSRAYLGTNGARFDTNGNDITVGVQMVDTSGQAGSLRKLGSGTLNVSNANTFTGPVVVDGGTLFASPGNAATNRAFSYASGITVNSGGTLRSTANALFGWDGSQAKPLTIHAGGTATADVGGDVNVGLVTLNGGTLAGGPSATWGSWSFGRATARQLAVTENSTVSAADVALFGGSTVDVSAGKTLSFTGTIVNTNNGASALIKTGVGTIQLSGTNTYTGATTVRGGTLNLTGSIAAGGDLIVADAGTGARMTNAGTLGRNAVTLGTGTNSVGGLTQSGGSTTASFLHLGLTPGSYGALKVDGGTFTVNGDANVGSWGSGYQTGGGLGGLVEISSGTVNVNGWITMSRWGATQDAVLHVSGGSLTYAGGGLVGNWNSDGADTSIITVAGSGAIATTNDTAINLSNNGSAANTGILNLNGGTVTPARVIGGRGFVNFNGGTLRAYSAQSAFLAVNSAFVHAGGAVIDSNDKAITIGQALLAPAGSGVTTVAVTDGGSGYTCAPIVKINGGSSSVPATAVANMVDDGTGAGTFKIASLTITSPGVYTVDPTSVTLIGGGAATPATFGTPVLAPNTSGALTKNGSGTLTLTAANTYVGGTTINAGTLTVSGSSATLGSGNLTVADGATCAIANPNGAVANAATVHLSGSAKLDLASGVNETVRFLYLNGVLQPAGTYNAVNLPSNITGSGSLIVTEGAVLLTPAEIWRDHHFDTIANTGDAADDADPDADGYANLLERAFGLNPLGHDPSGRPFIDPGSPQFVLVFQHAKNAGDLGLVLEVSSDLNPVNWQPAVLAPAANADGAMQVIDEPGSDVRMHRFTATSAAARKFYRLRVQR